MTVVNGRDIQVMVNDTLLELTRDITPSSPADQIDMSSRKGGKFKQHLGGQIDLGFEFQCVWDPANAEIQSLITASIDESSVSIKVGTFTGDPPQIDEGWGCECQVLAANFTGPLNDGAFLDVTVKPDPTQVPTRYQGGMAISP